MENDPVTTIFIGSGLDGINLNNSVFKDEWPHLSFFGNMHPDKRREMYNHLMHSFMVCETKPSSLDVILLPYFLELLYYRTRKMTV